MTSDKSSSNDILQIEQQIQQQIQQVTTYNGYLHNRSRITEEIMMRKMTVWLGWKKSPTIPEFSVSDAKLISNSWEPFETVIQKGEKLECGDTAGVHTFRTFEI